MRFSTFHCFSVLFLLPFCLQVGGADEPAKGTPFETEHSLLQRMENAIVPVLPPWRDMTMNEVLDFLDKAGRERVPDGEAPIIFKASPGLKKLLAKEPPKLKRPALPPILVAQLRNVNLRDTCDFVCEIANLRYVVRDDAVIITLPDELEIPE